MARLTQDEALTAARLSINLEAFVRGPRAPALDDDRILVAHAVVFLRKLSRSEKEPSNER